MSEQRSNWFQRLVGADGVASLAIEEELGRLKEEAKQLGQQLDIERALVVARDHRIEELDAQAQTAERDLKGKLEAMKQATEERLEFRSDLEKEYNQVTTELEALQAAQQKLTDERNKLSLALTRQRDESAKLTKSLAAAKDQVAQGEAALQAAHQQVSELEGKLGSHGSDAQKARAQAIELERTAEVRAMDLAESTRKLQAVETRASKLEHELAATKQAQQSAEASAAALSDTASEYAKLKEKHARQETELQGAGKERAQRELALRMVNDLWSALNRTVGEAAALALVLGIDTGHVERSSNLVDATSALKRAFEDKALCQGIKVEPLEDGMLVELRNSQLPGHAAATHWLMASATRFLEKAVGMELAIENSTVEQDRLTFRLQKSIDPRAAS